MVFFFRWIQTSSQVLIGNAGTYFVLSTRKENGLQQCFSFFQVMKCYPTGATSFNSTPESGKFPRLISPSTKTYVSAGDLGKLKTPIWYARIQGINQLPWIGQRRFITVTLTGLVTVFGHWGKIFFFPKSRTPNPWISSLQPLLLKKLRYFKSVFCFCWCFIFVLGIQFFGKHEFFGQSLTSFLFSPKEPLIKLHHGTKLCHTSLHLNATFRLESRAFGGLVMKENLGVDKPMRFCWVDFLWLFLLFGGGV